ncbi:MAG: nucleotidyltransferase substrate binding protein [Chitinispirillales bacterium]|jgi:nucleotidyltransferase substrate binding protein (TIGR01987 family)|nr:nucleotidyltransferase substrate binding protein [Chitinispirillales bacterium]
MPLPEKRWIQRLDNYEKAVAVLEKAFSVSLERELTEVERMGLIQAFEFSFELAWNLMKDFLYSKGVIDIIGSRTAIRQAFSYGLIENGAVWMDMINRRNETSHCYDETIAIKVITSVTNSYIEELKNFLAIMKQYK